MARQLSKGEPVIETVLRGLRVTPSRVLRHEAGTDRRRRAERLLRGRLPARRRWRPGRQRHRRAAAPLDAAGPQGTVVRRGGGHQGPPHRPRRPLVEASPTSSTPGRCTARSAPTARRSTPTSTRNRSTRSSSRASTRRRTPASRARTTDGTALADWLRSHEVDAGRRVRPRHRPLRARHRARRRRERLHHPRAHSTCAPAWPPRPPSEALTEMRDAGVERRLSRRDARVWPRTVVRASGVRRRAADVRRIRQAGSSGTCWHPSSPVRHRTGAARPTPTRTHAHAIPIDGLRPRSAASRRPTRPQRPWKLRAALLGEGLHALGDVLGAEQQGLTGALAGEGVAEAAEGGGVDGLLGGGEGERGAGGERGARSCRAPRRSPRRRRRARPARRRRPRWRRSGRRAGPAASPGRDRPRRRRWRWRRRRASARSW